MQSQGALSFTELVLNASFLVQCVMLFLLALSIVSWTIIISRNNQYRIGRAKADEFEDRFWSGIDLNNLYQDCMKRPNELVGLEVIYSAGFKEFVRLVNSGPADQEVVMSGTYRQMKVACSREVELLETHLPTLATIGSISPYIGLFGTVWGIMHAFVSLAAVKNATLAMVAPPIAEALIATAMGLFAAIPAVMFYNRFVTKVEALENRYYNFMDEFSTILNRRLVTIRSQLNNRNNATPQAAANAAPVPAVAAAQVNASGVGSYGNTTMAPPAGAGDATAGYATASPEGYAPAPAENLGSSFNATTYERERELERERQRERERELRERERLEKRERELREREQREREQRERSAATLNASNAAAAAAVAVGSAPNAAAQSNTPAPNVALGQSSMGQSAMGQNMAPNMAQPNRNRPNRNPLANPATSENRSRLGPNAQASAASAAAAAAANQAAMNNAPLQGISANTGATVPPLNDPHMAANYRGVVPPRNAATNANLAHAQLPGGAVTAVKPNMAAAPVKSEGPVYKSGVDMERLRARNNARNNDSEPHYIAPGGQNVRRNVNPAANQR